MFFIRLIFKVVLFPIIVIVTLIQWAGEFLIGLSSVVLNLLAGLILLIAVLAYLMGISDGHEALIIALTGFMFFLAPRLGGAVVGIISAANDVCGG